MKLSKGLLREKTRAATVGTVTFNAPGVYYPPYGKTIFEIQARGVPGNSPTGGNYAYTNPPDYQYTNPPDYQYTNPPVASGTNPPVASGSNPPVYQYTNPPVYQYTNPPVYQYTNPPTATGTNPPVATGSNPPTATGTNPPVATGSNPPVPAGSNPPTGGNFASVYWVGTYNQVQNYQSNPGGSGLPPDGNQFVFGTGNNSSCPAPFTVTQFTVYNFANVRSGYSVANYNYACTPNYNPVVPGNARFTPGNTNFSPGNTNFSPGNTNFAPGNTNFAPGNDVYNPGNAVYNPGNDVYNPGNTNFSPGNTNFTPGNDVYNPGNDVYNPGNDVYNPYYPGNVGASTNVLGISLPGGAASSLAPVIGYVQTQQVEYSNTGTPVSVPSGGYVIIRNIL